MKHWKIFFFGNSQLNAAAAIPEQNKPYYYVCRYIISKVHNDFKSKTFKNEQILKKATKNHENMQK